MGKDKDLTLADRLKSVDFYKSLPKELAEPTVSGASFSMLVMGLIGTLFISHLLDFLQPSRSSEIMVDVNGGQDFLGINLDVILPKVPCGILSLDIVDVTGTHIVDFNARIQKHRLGKSGEWLDSSNEVILKDEGGKKKDELSQEEVGQLYKDTLSALDKEEGCNVVGIVQINKVPGNFHISTHAFGEVVQRIYMGGRKLDFSHTIKHLSFGEDHQMKMIEQRFGDKFVFDLDQTTIDQSHFLYQGQMLANYYIDVNEVEYMDVTGKTPQFYEGFKHRSSRSLMAQLGLPAIFFRYELSPIKLRYTVANNDVTPFITTVLALVGGLFTVAGIVEAFIRNSVQIVSGPDEKHK